MAWFRRSKKKPEQSALPGLRTFDQRAQRLLNRFKSNPLALAEEAAKSKRRWLVLDAKKKKTPDIEQEMEREMEKFTAMRERVHEDTELRNGIAGKYALKKVKLLVAPAHRKVVHRHIISLLNEHSDLLEPAPKSESESKEVISELYGAVRKELVRSQVAVRSHYKIRTPSTLERIFGKGEEGEKKLMKVVQAYVRYYSIIHRLPAQKN